MIRKSRAPHGYYAFRKRVEEQHKDLIKAALDEAQRLRTRKYNRYTKKGAIEFALREHTHGGSKVTQRVFGTMYSIISDKITELDREQVPPIPERIMESLFS